ncbi:DUF2254 domain-containing protein [Pseudaestuariivita atlantica]|uniref:DUF2254 domain-containing protein n=1 Tax=Pseudaestuariivita atlantica TaxID=1317121 RepID=A0A0L1JUY3_9RHOB|nr:DUF2254 domain-containing protein [Pseudaestuariivita atlantica]KNG95560.1 hypothetical protein ATO11_02935 [Pseudaestuariivita atlantica]
MRELLELPHTVVRKALEYWRKLWVRVVLMGALAGLAMALTQPVSWLLPEDLQTRLAGSAADRLLDIIAGAMLSVTIFSLTVMVTVFNNVSSQWTPRIHRLAMQDEVTLHTLATFIGAWVYALMGIVLRELGIFPDNGATVLFAVTVLVLVYVGWSLIRWVLHLQTFGSLLASTRQVEDITTEQLKERLNTPCLGAVPMQEDPPDTAEILVAERCGYVQRIYQEALNAYCEDHDLTIWLLVMPGDFVSLHEPLVAVEGDIPDDLRDTLDAQIRLGDVRIHDQDPRFGLVVLSEIGSRALSPGINDPGTAIDVITRGQRILALYRDETEVEKPAYERLCVRPLSAGALIDDVFGPIARHGAGQLDVQICLQKALASLARHPDKGIAQAAREERDRCGQRALQALAFAPDKARLKDHLDGGDDA